MPIRRVFKVEDSVRKSPPKQVEFKIKETKPVQPEKKPETEVEEVKSDPLDEKVANGSLDEKVANGSMESEEITNGRSSPEVSIGDLELDEPINDSPEPNPGQANLSSLKLVLPKLPVMDSDDGMSAMMTEDEDAQSMINMKLSGEDGRIRKRSISYDNPELMKLIKTAGRPGIRHHSDAPLSSLSEVSGGSHRPSSVPLFLTAKQDETREKAEKSIIEEEAEGESLAPGSAASAAADTIYDTFKNSDSGKVSVRKFLNALTASGIRTTDPRLDASMHKLRRIMKKYGADFDAASTLHLDEEQFKDVIKPNAMTISRFLRTNFVIPEWNEFCRTIFRLYSISKNNDSGEPSNFIPQLASLDKNLWGVALCSVDGQRFSVGDYNVPFCLQAVSRVLNYAIVLNDVGAEKVHDYVGQEPSGRNAKELVLDECNKPHNPMINGGAIVISALLKSEEKHMADRFDAVDSTYKKMAGNNEFIGFLNQAYLSERQVSFRNYAMGYFLRENKCLPEPERLNETLELMLQLCAVEVSCESLAVMAATLANGGVCPITGEYVIGSHCVRDVLSLMYTTGMNDYSGQFAFHVGLPAKSSISGAIMLVIPNVMGIALWSPPLDCRNNSVRGLQFCQELVKVFNFHNYDNLRFTQKKLDPRKMQVENKAHQVVLTLFSAANGDLTALSRFYLQGVDLTVADYDRRTPLHIASAEGHMACVKFLVEKARVPCRPVDRWNNTPADDARYHSHPEIADYLENWDLKRGTLLQPVLPTTPIVNGVTPMKLLPVVSDPIATHSPKSRDGYEASQSEEEEDYDSGEGSSVPGSASVLSKRIR